MGEVTTREAAAVGAWQEALERAARRIRQGSEKFGQRSTPEEVAARFPGKWTTPEEALQAGVEAGLEVAARMLEGKD